MKLLLTFDHIPSEKQWPTQLSHLSDAPWEHASSPVLVLHVPNTEYITLAQWSRPQDYPVHSLLSIRISLCCCKILKFSLKQNQLRYFVIFDCLILFVILCVLTAWFNHIIKKNLVIHLPLHVFHESHRPNMLLAQCYHIKKTHGYFNWVGLNCGVASFTVIWILQDISGITCATKSILYNPLIDKFPHYQHIHKVILSVTKWYKMIWLSGLCPGHSNQCGAKTPQSFPFL